MGITFAIAFNAAPSWHDAMMFPVGLEEKYDMYSEYTEHSERFRNDAPLFAWCAQHVQYVLHPQPAIDAGTRRILDDFLFDGTDHTKGLTYDFAYSGPVTFANAENSLRSRM